MQIGERIFRQMKQKTQAILGVLTSIFVKYGGKYSVKMRACDFISGYLIKRLDQPLQFLFVSGRDALLQLLHHVLRQAVKRAV